MVSFLYVLAPNDVTLNKKTRFPKFARHFYKDFTGFLLRIFKNDNIVWYKMETYAVLIYVDCRKHFFDSIPRQRPVGLPTSFFFKYKSLILIITNNIL